MPQTKEYNFEALKKTTLSEQSNWAVKLLHRPWIILLATAGFFAPIILIANPNQAVQQLGIVIALFSALFFTVFAIAIIIFIAASILGNKKEEAIFRFSVDNKLQSVWPDAIYGHLPDSVKGQYIVSEKVDHAFNIPVGGKPVTVYEYTIETNAPGSRSSYKAYYKIASFELTKAYPHLFLDGKVNGVNPKYARNQKISLEGDFDKHFTLYAPDNTSHRTGALAVISPDVMATLIDTSAAFDIEIKGKHVYIITQAPIYTFDTLPKVLRAAGFLIKEMEHLDNTWQPIITPAGQTTTLQSWSVPRWIIVVIAITAIVLFNWQSFRGLLQLLF